MDLCSDPVLAPVLLGDGSGPGILQGTSRKCQDASDSGFVKKTIVPRTQDGTSPVERCWDKISAPSSLDLPRPTLQLRSGQAPLEKQKWGKILGRILPFWPGGNRRACTDLN